MNKIEKARILFSKMHLEECEKLLSKDEDKYSVLNQYFLALARGNGKEILELGSVIKENKHYLELDESQLIICFHLVNDTQLQHVENELLDKSILKASES